PIGGKGTEDPMTSGAPKCSCNDRKSRRSVGLAQTGNYAHSYVTLVGCAEKLLQISMGRVGFEPTSRRLKVGLRRVWRLVHTGQTASFSRVQSSVLEFLAPQC